MLLLYTRTYAPTAIGRRSSCDTCSVRPVGQDQGFFVLADDTGNTVPNGTRSLVSKMVPGGHLQPRERSSWVILLKVIVLKVATLRIVVRQTIAVKNIVIISPSGM